MIAVPAASGCHAVFSTTTRWTLRTARTKAPVPVSQFGIRSVRASTTAAVTAIIPSAGIINTSARPTYTTASRVAIARPAPMVPAPGPRCSRSSTAASVGVVWSMATPERFTVSPLSKSFFAGGAYK